MPNWEGAEIIQKGMSKSIRKGLEAAYIYLQNTINEKPGFFTWAKFGAKMALKGEENKIPKKKQRKRKTTREREE